MFSILTVLAVIIADVHGQFFMSQDEECTATIPGIKKTTTVLMCDPEVMLAFLVINERWIDGPIWNDRLASKALKEALKQKKTNADYKIRQEKHVLN
ncbi:hypothetical protein GCK32_008797 [Trichostrongylus colubriformis]|uniref:Uncharacterized protein n=1 Tax=Trichostrongylus colubriformis TaxID=6319 RepID=A0AAN8ET57_TRICO